MSARRPPSGRPTARGRRASNLVVYVGDEGLLCQTVHQAALTATGASVRGCDVSSVATVAAQARPYAIVVSRLLYDFGGQEFDALARDLNAELVVVPPAIQLPLLATLLSEAAHRLR